MDLNMLTFVLILAKKLQTLNRLHSILFCDAINILVNNIDSQIKQCIQYLYITSISPHGIDGYSIALKC